MVGMTRAHMADPHIVRKMMQGREDDIRPCVGANYCLDRIYQGGMALCAHNPSTGRENELPHDIVKAESRRKVVIVGAGPGGLEAARVAAARGHEVVVFEAAPSHGGQVRLIAQSRRRAELIGIVDWRYDQCLKAGVTFRFNTYADADAVTAEQPNVVVIATGGLPESARLREGDNLTVSAWDILSGDAKPGTDVLIHDEAGDHAGLMAAEMLAEGGAKVEVITADRSFAAEVMAMNLTPYMRALQKHGAKLTVAKRLDAVHREGNRLKAVIGTDYGPVQDEQIHDQIVVNCGVRPLDELYLDLKPLSRNLGAVDYDRLIDRTGELFPANNPEGAFDLYRIGDAVSSRNIHAAIYDAMRFGVRI